MIAPVSLMSHSPLIAAQSIPPRWAALLIAVGTTCVILSLGGLILLPLVPPIDEQQAALVSPPTSGVPAPSATPPGQARVDRQLISPSTLTQTSTPQIISTSPSGRAAEEAAIFPTAAQPTAMIETTPISWTEAEKNALSWMCFYEVGGMGAARNDGCLSVISTVRARYVYGSGMGDDVLSVLQWPNQFNIEVRTGSPHPDLISVVEQYQNGARGSCNGYFYFDSVPGGPSLCIIYGAANQFIEFHNGWD
jgi:hypothetical protein